MGNTLYVLPIIFFFLTACTKNESAKTLTLGSPTLLFIAIASVAFTLVLLHSYRLHKRYIQTKVQLESQKSILCARVSQEFKNPVSIIIGLTERLKEDLSASPQNKNWVAIDILSRQTENLYMLIDNMASIANLQRIDSRSNVKNGNVIAYLQYIYECFSTFAETKRISYSFYSNASDLLTTYEPEYLRIILHNLIGISIKLCTESDHINLHINSDRNNRNYSIEVSHNGKCILPEGIEIGLTVAEHLVEKLGGWMRTKKSPEGDTVYLVVFPLDKGKEASDEKPITIQKKALSPTYMVEDTSRAGYNFSDKPVALIAQENKYLGYYLSTLLEEKFHVILETNGESALKTATQTLPDIIVSDVILPRKSGFDLCKQIKNSSTTNHIPVILITSTHSKEERVKGFTSGADACFERPLHENEFRAVVNQLLTTRKKIRETYTRITGMNKNYPEDQPTTDNNLEFLERVTNVIYKEIANTDNIIEKISSEMCLSSSQLNRKIKAITGITTSIYILKTRLNKARKQLANTNKPIGDVAMECGFNDFAYFSRSFKKEFGMTPTTFQRLPEAIGK